LVIALILKKFSRHIDGVHFEVGDLLGYGASGLRSAALRFDPARGNRFSTCAFPWIRHHIGRAIQDSGRTIRIPVHLDQKIEKVAKARDWLRAMGAEQTVEAIAEASGMSVREVTGCLAAPLPPVSLSAPRAFDNNNEDQSTLQDHIADRDSPMPDEGLSNADKQALMDDVMMVMEDALSPSERRILLARSGMDARTFGEDPTLAEVGVQIGVSRERVRQLQNQAIRKVRDHFPARAAEAMTC
jgi:RNA polymerase sigma factor (sigma-70 family)